MVGEAEQARGKFSIVYLPCDDSKPLEQWELDLPKDKEAQVSCLTDRLRAHFKQSAHSSHNEQQQREIFKQQLLSQLPAGATMDDNMLNIMLQMDSLVDSIPMVLNTRQVNHTGINMYVDDKGTAKGLATNKRASAIAQACGKMMEVRGDAFLARLFDNDDEFIRLDFKLSEVASDAKWIQVGKAQALASAASGASASSSAASRVQLPTNGSTNPTCGNPTCAQPGKLRCSRCKKQFYCSAPCQRTHWKAHKPSCHP